MSLIHDPSVRMLQHRNPTGLSSARLRVPALRPTAKINICNVRTTVFLLSSSWKQPTPILGNETDPDHLSCRLVQPRPARHPEAHPDNHHGHDAQGEGRKDIDLGA